MADPPAAGRSASLHLFPGASPGDSRRRRPRRREVNKSEMLSSRQAGNHSASTWPALLGCPPGHGAPRQLPEITLVRKIIVHRDPKALPSQWAMAAANVRTVNRAEILEWTRLVVPSDSNPIKLIKVNFYSKINLRGSPPNSTFDWAF